MPLKRLLGYVGVVWPQDHLASTIPAASAAKTTEKCAALPEKCSALLDLAGSGQPMQESLRKAVGDVVRKSSKEASVK